MKSGFAFLLTGALLGGAARAEIINFHDAKRGSVPAGWRAGITGQGKAKWSVETDDSSPGKPKVLKQSAQVASHSFPWCVLKKVSLQDGYIQVKFKPVAGKEDQGGGLIWRWQDGDDYYVARANALEDNVTVYHTIKGVRRECGRSGMKVASNVWHTLRVDFHGMHYVVTFDGAPALEWTDDTFKNAGAVGVWTKADSVIEFDDFVFEGK